MLEGVAVVLILLVIVAFLFVTLKRSKFKLSKIYHSANGFLGIFGIAVLGTLAVMLMLGTRAGTFFLITACFLSGVLLLIMLLEILGLRK